jgi:hypothetical protein
VATFQHLASLFVPARRAKESHLQLAITLRSPVLQSAHRMRQVTASLQHLSHASASVGQTVSCEVDWRGSCHDTALRSMLQTTPCTQHITKATLCLGHRSSRMASSALCELVSLRDLVVHSHDAVCNWGPRLLNALAAQTMLTSLSVASVPWHGADVATFVSSICNMRQLRSLQLFVYPGSGLVDILGALTGLSRLRILTESDRPSNTGTGLAMQGLHGCDILQAASTLQCLQDVGVEGRLQYDASCMQLLSHHKDRLTYLSLSAKTGFDSRRDRQHRKSWWCSLGAMSHLQVLELTDFSLCLATTASCLRSMPRLQRLHVTVTKRAQSAGWCMWPALLSAKGVTSLRQLSVCIQGFTPQVEGDEMASAFAENVTQGTSFKSVTSLAFGGTGVATLGDVGVAAMLMAWHASALRDVEVDIGHDDLSATGRSRLKVLSQVADVRKWSVLSAAGTCLLHGPNVEPACRCTATEIVGE